ncbi:MAG: hypothetical protein U0163_10910 [Gemmatimonadaceae bacterium]
MNMVTGLGDNKWTCAILARDADTGELRRVYQLTPHDQWDYDGVNENILVDMPVKGSMRKALVHSIATPCLHARPAPPARCSPRRSCRSTGPAGLT